MQDDSSLEFVGTDAGVLIQFILVYVDFYDYWVMRQVSKEVKWIVERPLNLCFPVGVSEKIIYGALSVVQTGQLRELDLACTGLTKNLRGVLGVFENLVVLNLRECTELDVLDVEFPQLRELNISFTKVDKLQFAAPMLEILDVSGTGVTFQGLGSTLLNFPNLRELYLCYCTNIIWEFFHNCSCPSLEVLSLTGTMIEDDMNPHLFAAHLPALKRISFSDTLIHNTYLEELLKAFSIAIHTPEIKLYHCPNIHKETINSLKQGKVITN